MSRTLRIIFLTIFIDLLGYGILIPVIPALFADTQSAFFVLPVGTNPTTGFILLGLLLALFPLGQFFATPVIGQFSDKYGRKKLLIWSILGTSLSYVLFAIGVITKNIPLLFFSRFFDGLTGGNISVAQAVMSDVTKPEDRAKTFGLLGAAFGLGFIFGPYIGGKLSSASVVHWFTPATPFWFAAILALINVSFIVFFLPETNKNPRSFKISFFKSFLNIGRARHLGPVSKLFTVNFFYSAGFTFFTTFFSVFLIKRFNFTEVKIGNFFAFVGVCSVLVQAIVTRFLVKRYTEKQVLSFTLLGLSLLVLSFLLPKTTFVLYSIVPFFALCNGLSMAMMSGLVSKTAPPQMQGEILGVNASVTALAQFFPAVLSGFIAYTISPESPLIFSSVTIFIAWVLFIFRIKKEDKK